LANGGKSSQANDIETAQGLARQLNCAEGHIPLTLDKAALKSLVEQVIH
jgi:hypothetical protein